MKIRAKMQCLSVQREEYQETVTLSAVVEGSEENKSFSRWTPAAHLTMTVSNPDVLGAFKEGEEYYLDFTPANRPLTPAL
jgi:hypothetical protein